MLSVGNIPPGEEIDVKTIWAMPLMMAGEDGHLRIPTTVGQIYGQSPLADGDDFSWGDEVQVANVTVRSSGVPVKVDGRLVGADAVQVRMNQPIDLVVGEWKPTPLLSRAADGTGIELELCPAPTSSAALNLAILVDHSGSMHASVPQGENGTATVHGAGVMTLRHRGVSEVVPAGDSIALIDLAALLKGAATGHVTTVHAVPVTGEPDAGDESTTSLRVAAMSLESRWS